MSGYQIPFHSVPVQLHVPVTKCSDLTVPLVDAEVNKLLSIGAIKAIPFSKENFYSRLFLVPKKEGTYRPVIDLSQLNRFVENFHFQMESISCLKTLLRRGDLMTCIDLKDAYLSVHVHKSSQKYPSVFPVEKQLICLPRPAIWAKYRSQGIYKANKTHSSLLTEKEVFK